MKVCHINLSRRFSGSERQTLLLIKQQLRDGCKVSIVVRHNSTFEKEAAKLPCDIISTRSAFMNQSAKLAKKCDIFHAHDEQGAQWAYMQRVKHKSPYLITHRLNKPLANKFFATKTYQQASALVGLSDSILNRLKQKYHPARSLKIPSSPISYPFNHNKVEQIWASHGHAYLVMHATSLEKHKGQDVTIEAARILQDQQPSIHVLILGNGPQEENLRKQAEGLSNVFFMSKQEDMGTWFAAANCLIHPSHVEGLGSVILEAMAAGLPVIASKVGGIPEIISHDQNGLLIPPGDPQALADAITKMASDKELSERLLTEAKSRLGEFDITQTNAQYMALYQELIGKQQ